MKVIREKFVPSLIVSILLASLGLALRFIGVNSELSLIVAGAILILTFTITLITYRPIRRSVALGFAKAEIAENGEDKSFVSFRSQLSEAIGASSRVEIAKNSGVSGWFSSFDESEHEIVNKIKTAQEVRMITNWGQSDFSKGTRVYDALTTNQKSKVKVLLVSPKSKFVSSGWAANHRLEKEESTKWIGRIKESIKDIKYLRSHYNIDIEYRFYNFPVTWHLWIIDEKAYVTAWLEKTKNRSSTKVIELTKHNDEDKHLYDMFINFFERIWEEYSEADSS